MINTELYHKCLIAMIETLVELFEIELFDHLNVYKQMTDI